MAETGYPASLTLFAEVSDLGDSIDICASGSSFKPVSHLRNRELQTEN